VRDCEHNNGVVDDEVSNEIRESANRYPSYFRVFRDTPLSAQRPVGDAKSIRSHDRAQRRRQARDHSPVVVGHGFKTHEKLGGEIGTLDV
jgi:hypothetical protein